MLEQFGVDYLTNRGITPEFALSHGLDETAPTSELINGRFNFRYNGDQVAKAFAEVRSLLWFPVTRTDGFVNYVARVNGLYRDTEGKDVRFLFTKSGRNLFQLIGSTSKGWFCSHLDVCFG